MKIQFLVLVPMLMIGAAFIGFANEKSKTVVEKTFGSAENKKRIESAPRVLAYRLSLPQDPSGKGLLDFRETKNYKVGPSVLVDPKISSQIRKLILDDSIDDPTSSKGCIPNFGVRLSFVDQQKTCDVYFCFECSILMVAEKEKWVGGSDFDSVNGSLAILMKKIFPKDAQIQALNKKLSSAEQPATAPESKPQGDEKPEPESEVRPQ